MTASRLLVAWLAALLAVGCGSEPAAPPPAEEAPAAVTPEETLRMALLEAAPGSVVEVPAGTLRFERGLSLSVDGVTVRGAGSARSILSFAGQRSGAEGLLVSANDVTLEGFAVEDAVGDAIKINECRNIVIRDVRTEWTNGPSSENGAYGLYPVQCEGVLIEDSSAIGASDAGIYVGQSSDIVVRNNSARFNVAGIEIENSTRAEVYGNDVRDNTGGILVFDLPGLPVQGGRLTRVYGNTIIGNNTENFAPEGNIVGTVPAGSGVMVNANDAIEIFDNDIVDHRTSAVMVVSYLITERPFDDPRYDPYPEGIHIHGNRIQDAGHAPDSEDLVAIAQAMGLERVPAIVWDGIVREAGQMNDLVCVHDNGEVQTMMLDAANGFAAPVVDADVFDCTLPALPVPGSEDVAEG